MCNHLSSSFGRCEHRSGEALSKATLPDRERARLASKPARARCFLCCAPLPSLSDSPSLLQSLGSPVCRLGNADYCVWDFCTLYCDSGNAGEIQYIFPPHTNETLSFLDEMNTGLPLTLQDLPWGQTHGGPRPALDTVCGAWGVMSREPRCSVRDMGSG